MKYDTAKERIFSSFVQRSWRKKHVHSKGKIDYQTICRMAWTAGGGKKHIQWRGRVSLIYESFIHMIIPD